MLKVSDFPVGTRIRFMAELDRHDQVEHPDAMPVLPAGTRGVIVENDGQSVVVRVPHPADPSRVVRVHLYPTPTSEDNCSLEIIRPARFSPEYAHGPTGPRVGTFIGDRDEHLENITPKELARIEAAWPEEPLL